jgi:hypothetical protein
MASWDDEARWPVDYWLRWARLKEQGLPCTISVEFLPGSDPLLALLLKPLPGAPLLSDPCPALHVSLCFASDLGSPLMSALAEQVTRKWHGETSTLTFDWLGGGGAAMLAASGVGACPCVTQLHAGGYYGGRCLHVSF